MSAVFSATTVNRLRSLLVPVLACMAAVCFGLGSRANAADAEGRAITNAIQQFEGGFYARAEVAFSNFVARYPESPQVPRALLYQGRSALEQGHFAPASDLLSTNVARAGGLADLFQFWLGRVQLASGATDKAAETFAAVAQTYTNSSVRLEAALGEVEAHIKLNQLQRAADVIQKPDGAFQSAARGRGTNDANVVRGYLMLAQAWLDARQYDHAAAILAKTSDDVSNARLRWTRQYLLCRVQIGSRHLEAALASSTNLVQLSGSDAGSSATAVALQGEILEQLQRPADAIKAYEQNLADSVPEGRRREAFLKTVEVALSANNVTNAIARLEKFLADRPADAVSDVAWLAVGELRLKQHQVGVVSTNGLGTTNLLDLALEAFGRLARDFPKSGYLGKAQLGRGWALLGQGKFTETLAAFQSATNLLAPSEDQAIACFKLADVQFQTGDYTNAIRNYQRVLREYSEFPRVRRELGERALYQIVQASRAARDLVSAGEAVQQITRDYPSSSYADQSLLLYGQAVNDLGNPARARQVFQESLALYPNSAFVPEVKLAIARTYERGGDWSAAAQAYERWCEEYSNHVNLAQAEFSRALATFQSGQESNALNLFTNFVTTFVTNALAARAQNWIGDYYFRRGMLGSGDAAYADFTEAERSYQRIYSSIGTNWPVTELTYEARVKAGRAAFRRQNYDQAIAYFTELTSRPEQCPPATLIEATFAYGDTYLARPNTNAIERFIRAREIFAYIPNTYPSDPQVPRAWGRIASCYFQLAALRGTNDPAGSAKDYAQAYEFYRKITNSTLADPASVAQAHIGMGDVRRRQAAAAAGPEAELLMKEALDHYLDVVYSPDERRPDAVWVRDAALIAAQVYEERKQWQPALELYTRVAEMIPPLRPSMEKRAAAVRQRQSLQTQ